jgi:anti-sigma B factor antagonist
MDLRISTRSERAAVVVSVSGDVDVASSPILREALDKPLVAQAPHIVVDLTELNFIDSTGLGVLVGAMKVARRYGASLRLVCTSPRILRVFDITGLNSVFPVDASLQDALSRGSEPGIDESLDAQL